MAGDGEAAAFGAIAKLQADMVKAQAQARIAQLTFQNSLAQAQAAQRGEAGRLRAELEAEAKASQTPGAQAQPEPLDLAGMFPEQPIDATGGRGSRPVTISDAIAQSANPVQGGAAVQTLLKGGGGGPDTTGAPPVITSQQQTSEFVRSPGFAGGTIYDPVVRTTRTTEPNVLSAAQAAQINQAQRQFEVLQQERRNEQRAKLTIDLAQTEGITPAEASRAVGALQRGDTPAFFEAMGGAITKANTVRDEARKLQARQLEASINASNASAEQSRASAANLRAMAVKRATDTQALTFDVLGFWSGSPGAPTKTITSNEAIGALRSLTDNGKFLSERQPVFEEAQRSLLRNTGRAYVLVGEGGNFSRAKFEAINAGPIVAAAQIASSPRATAEERRAAEKFLTDKRDSDGNPLFKVRNREVSAFRPENHQLLDTLLEAGATREKLTSDAGLPLPVEALNIPDAPQPLPPKEELEAAPAGPSDVPLTPEQKGTGAARAGGSVGRALADVAASLGVGPEGERRSRATLREAEAERAQQQQQIADSPIGRFMRNLQEELAAAQQEGNE